MPEEVIRTLEVRFANDKEYRNEVTEQIMVYFDSFLALEKSIILAKLFNAHIAGYYDWPHFNYLSTCLNSLHPKAFHFLRQLSAHHFKIPEGNKEGALPRDLENESLLTSSGISFQSSVWSSSFSVSEIGKDLYNYGIK